MKLVSILIKRNVFGETSDSASARAALSKLIRASSKS